MTKKVLVILMVIVFIVGNFTLLPVAFADNTNDLQNQRSLIQEERTSIQEELSETEQELLETLLEMEQLQEQIDRVIEAISDNQEMIVETEDNMGILELELEQLEDEIEYFQRDIDVRFDLLQQRAVSYHKSGGNISYLQVILGSKGFGDLVERVFAIYKVAKADTDLLAQYEKSIEQLEEKQSLAEGKMVEMEELFTELVGMQHHLTEQQDQNEELVAMLQEKESEYKETLVALQERDSELASQESEMLARINEARERERVRLAEASTQTVRNAETTNVAATSSIQQVSRTTGGSVTDVINAGKKYIGNSVYVFGGGRTAYDIQNGRFDCSGFVRWAYSQIGVNLSYSARSMVNDGRRVSTSEMRPGDLVFFDTYRTDGHVGIYVGGGQFIGSQSGGVTIVSMNSGYWKNTFNGRVVRVVE
ncbi:NlpC/P60 family protein [Evansella sp. AB-rgal1]|uniref:C40 family peptidase n=1 Tax=Evansella sp. AB-rgal1 TaxID=3242696 RepID=UPI00359E0FD6